MGEDQEDLEVVEDPEVGEGLEEVVEVVLRKGEKGLGFSILDYQVMMS